MSDNDLLIANYPLFALLSPADVRDLVSLALKKHVSAGDIIVHEGDLVDAVYFIASGSAEVSRKIITVEKAQTIHVATLSKGDAIGLSATDFFSHSGLRTATVTAITNMDLLIISIPQFKSFLEKPTVNYPALKNLSDKITLMNFLKQSELFNHLSNEKIKRFANHLTRASIKANSIIYHAGDRADKCYFILSGCVSIISTDSQQTKSNTMAQHSLFGEDALQGSLIREESVRAETDCELLIMDRDEFFAATEETQSKLKIRLLLGKTLGKLKSIWK